MSFDRCTHPATPEGLKACVAVAQMIEADIYRNQFDPTLDKYGLCRVKVVELPQVVEEVKEYTIASAWADYKRLKAATVAPSTQSKKWKYIDKFVDATPPELLPIPRAIDFLHNLRERYSDGTISNVISALQAAVSLAIDLDRYQGKNPYPKAKKHFALQGKVIHAFTVEDVKVILEAFTSDERGKGGAFYSPSYFYHFVMFRFLTGCRPSEAVALEWDDITVGTNGKYKVRINKRYSSGALMQGTKNGVGERILPCNKALTDLLKSIPHRHTKLVFPSFHGSYLDAQHFGDKFWRPIVKRLHEQKKISCYLPFYDIRHTFGTHALRSGIDIKSLSTFMGNSPEVLLEHYVEADENIITPDYDL